MRGNEQAGPDRCRTAAVAVLGRRGTRGSEGYDPTDAIRAALLRDPAILSVELVGSRAAGTPTALSDWDFRVSSADAAAVAGRLPALVAGLRPLLAKMWRHLLRPLGAIAPPGTQEQAVSAYFALRRGREQQSGDAVPRELGTAVIARLRTAGLVP